MNKKPTILAVAALGSLALIGTGFAGWVIVANATQTASGNIIAYEVTDNRLTASKAEWGTEKAGSGTIIFGKPATQSATSAWFYGEGTGMEQEKLEDYFVVNVKSGDVNDTSDATVSGEIVVNDNKGVWADAVSKKYVAAPTITFNGTSSDVVLSGSATGRLTLKGTAEVPAKFTVKFNWGNYFKVDDVIKNPYDFFNTKKAGGKVSESGSVTWGEEAKNVMGDIANLNALTFTATVTFTHAAHAAA